MVKKLLSLILALSMTVCLVACGTAQQAEAEPAPAAEPEQTTAPSVPEAPAATDAPVATDVPSEPEMTEYNVDFCIVGGGGGGIAAAAQAADNGLDTLVLEKTNILGGTCAMAHGIFAIGSHIQAEAGVTDTAADLFRACMEYHHWLSDPEITKTLFAKSAETIDWMEEAGVKFLGVSKSGDSYQTWHNPDSSVGDALSVLAQKAEDAGVKFMLETSGKELIITDGAVTGVIAETANGEKIRVNAKAVLLATGGFGDNEEMMDEYTPFDYNNLYSLARPGHDGDGINMGLAAGADTVGMSAVMLAGGTVAGVPYTAQVRIAAGRSPFLWVNEKAERFADESIMGNFSFTGHAMSHQKAVYSIFDENIMRWFDENGNAFNHAPMDKARTEVDTAIADGATDVFKADSIEELAEMMGIDPVAFKATVDRYNEFCANGVDDDYGKLTYLMPLAEAPFYGFRLETAYYTTVGGLRINTDAQVVNTDGNVIPGLYATGGDAGGLYGDAYDVVVCAGSQVAFTVNFGRIAADTAKSCMAQ